MIFSLISATWGLAIHHNQTSSSNTIRLDLSPTTTVEEEPSSCPSGKVFRQCGSACPRTCSGFGRPDPVCITACVTGCFCDYGYMLDEVTDKCIKVSTPEYCSTMPCPWQDANSAEPHTLVCGDGSAHDITMDGAWEACSASRGGRAGCPTGYELCANMACSSTGCNELGGTRKCLGASPKPRCAIYDGDCASCVSAGCTLNGDKCLESCPFSDSPCFHIPGERTATEVSQLCLSREEQIRKNNVCSLLNDLDCASCTQVPFCTYAKDVGGCIAECPRGGCGESVFHNPAECS